MGNAYPNSRDREWLSSDTVNRIIGPPAKTADRNDVHAFLNTTTNVSADGSGIWEYNNDLYNRSL